MTLPLTPGAYLGHRRRARGLSVADVAAQLTADRHDPEHLRIERLKLIEADDAPASFGTIVALRQVYHFDIHVLALLWEIAQDAPVAPPRLCRLCACSEHDACVQGHHRSRCWWSEADLCSTCSAVTSGQGVHA